MFCVLLFNSVSYVFLLLCMFCSVYSIFIVPTGILRLPWLRFFRAFSSVVRQMPGYNSQRRGTARTLPKIFVLSYVLFVLCRSVYCLCVNVYCTTATGWQPNCSLTNISYIIQCLAINSLKPSLFWKANRSSTDQEIPRIRWSRKVHRRSHIWQPFAPSWDRSYLS